jgi:hypothetical protein
MTNITFPIKGYGAMKLLLRLSLGEGVAVPSINHRPNGGHCRRSSMLRESPPAPSKRLSKRGRRGFWARGLNWYTTGKPKNMSVPVGSQINSRRGSVGPCAAGPYRECRHRAARWKKSPRPTCQAISTPKKSPVALPPTLRSSRRRRRHAPF